MNITKLITLAALSAMAIGCTSIKETYNPKRGEGYYILTPAIPDRASINSPERFGVRPGAPFIYNVAVSGVVPIELSAENLPKGLKLDPESGIISGKITDLKQQRYNVTLKAKNRFGSDVQNLEIVVGEKIQITPPMGWSSWIATKKTVSAAAVMRNANQLVELGLKNLGYEYVNIDDYWQGTERGGKYNAIQPNPKTFPNIEALSNQIHSMGLKFGIYSTPWITSYARCIGGSSNRESGEWSEADIVSMKNMNVEGRASLVGKFRFDDNDAKQWADWGVDYMKYDWNPNDSASIVNMATALRRSGRDIVFSISNSCPRSEWKRCRDYVQVFRTGGDIRARWDGDGDHLNLRENWDNHIGWLEEAFRGNPGHTPDPDFLMVGLQKYGSKMELTADELYHHVSSFVLWGAPMLLSCDLEKLTPFELSLVTNLEMLAINQDKISIPAKRVPLQDGVDILVKPLSDGNRAFGVFNFNDKDVTVTVDLRAIGVRGESILRDVWRQTDIGLRVREFKCVVPAHGCVVVRSRASK
ncbi:MAG: putative Ig domain-containing protein [Rikenellaceae bacterium]